MSVDFALPQMGFDMTEAKIAHWTRAEGDRVEPGEILAEIATEKVTLELVDHPGGVIEKILVPEGETVLVGTPIVRFGAAAGAALSQPGLAPREAIGPGRNAGEPVPTDTQTQGPEERVKASPLARRLAEEKGVDIGRVEGSGPMGRILRDDVLRAAERNAMRTSSAAVPAPSGEAPTPHTLAASTPATGPQELSPMRQAIARRMTESKQQIPHFYLTIDVRMDSAIALRKELAKALGEELNVTINDFVVKATALALAKVPQLNVWFVDGKIRAHDRINIGLAVALEDGLVVPALLDCQNRSLGQIAAGAKDLAARARKGAMKAEEFTGGTFTVSNLGMYGVESFQGIINPPQVGILSVGAAKKAPVVENDQIIVGSVMRVGISCDHRATDGAVGARFLAEIKKLLENPMLLLL